MRGSRIVNAISGTRNGIIPAHAGLTTCDLVTAIYPGDHPRACGAHHQYFQHCLPQQGSSPRMRGSPAIQNAFGSGHGIIPAHAGLTRCRI